MLETDRSKRIAQKNRRESKRVLKRQATRQAARQAHEPQPGPQAFQSRFSGLLSGARRAAPATMARDPASVGPDLRLAAAMERGFARMEARLGELVTVLRQAHDLEDPAERISELQEKVGDLQSTIARLEAEKDQIEQLWRSGALPGDLEEEDPAEGADGLVSSPPADASPVGEAGIEPASDDDEREPA